ncbi:hypothetical protein EJ02DRAFT_108255 [Clathrospora elynae]|uniref:Uncharacterized protein n=1 Tax=Clathrospora elynae TaxID=706981 RepID=A0A6A5SUA2_9PLEO|nr:hypothetical protein EJ02DRAFT_108255 [Clathrospora elynae]
MNLQFCRLVASGYPFCRTQATPVSSSTEFLGHPLSSTPYCSLTNSLRSPTLQSAIARCPHRQHESICFVMIDIVTLDPPSSAIVMEAPHCHKRRGIAWVIPIVAHRTPTKASKNTFSPSKATRPRTTMTARLVIRLPATNNYLRRNLVRPELTAAYALCARAWNGLIASVQLASHSEVAPHRAEISV